MLSEIQIIESVVLESRLDDFTAEVHFSASWQGTSHDFSTKVIAPWNPEFLSFDSILLDNHLINILNTNMALSLNCEDEENLKKVVLKFYKNKIRA